MSAGLGSGPGIEKGTRRKGGKLAADEEADKVVGGVDEAMEEEILDIERALTFQSTALSRMRTTWQEENQASMVRIRSAVEDAFLDAFMDAHLVMEDLYGVVREPVIDPETGEVQQDAHGLTVWVKDEYGRYVEDWNRLGHKEREHFLLHLTTHLFEWEQRAADIWAEAMFAKSVWTESFAHFFDEARGGTVDHRNARGNMKSAEDRYFAVYYSVLSKKADSLTRSLERITLRLRDSMT